MLNLNTLRADTPYTNTISENQPDITPSLNIKNLNDKYGSNQESQTISVIYNLLHNDDTVRWNSGNIKLRSPKGLTQINKIRFRSFEGELLPYTQLSMPELSIELRAFFSPNFDKSVYLIGNDNTEGIKPRFTFSDEQSQSSSDNVITKFTKAWTYNENAESQIEYNIQELVDYLNEVLTQWFGQEVTKMYYGVDTGNNWIPFTIDSRYTQNSENVCGYAIVHDSSYNIYKTVAKADNTIEYKKLCRYYEEKSNLHYNENEAGSLIVFHATSATPWITIQVVRSTDAKILYSKLGYGVQIPVNEKTKLIGDIGTAFVGDYCFIVPIRDWNTMYKTWTIVSSNGTTYTGTFEAITYYRDYTIIGINQTSDTSFVVYTLGMTNTSSSTAFDLVPFNIYIDGTELNVTLVAGNIITNIITIDEFKRQNMYELNDGITWKQMWEITYNSDTYLCFDGRVIIKTTTNETGPGIRFLQTYPLTVSGDTFYVTNQAECEYGNYDAVPMGIVKTTSINIVANVEYAYRNGHYPCSVYNYLDNSYPITYSDTETGFRVYYQNGKAMNVAEKSYLGNFECYSMYNGQASYPLNCIDNHITYSGELFSYDNSIISFPTITWSDSEFITFVPIITTNPKYFNIRFNIPQTTTVSELYSIVQNNSITEFHGLNEHVYSTLETLLVMQYEYNDLMLRCSNFTNNDNIVFSVNEICRITFKEMQVSSNVFDLDINVCDSNGETIDRETLKKLYGKLVLCVDFSQ